MPNKLTNMFDASGDDENSKLPVYIIPYQREQARVLYATKKEKGYWFEAVKNTGPKENRRNESYIQMSAGSKNYSAYRQGVTLNNAGAHTFIGGEDTAPTLRERATHEFFTETGVKLIDICAKKMKVRYVRVGNSCNVVYVEVDDIDHICASINTNIDSDRKFENEIKKSKGCIKLDQAPQIADNELHRVHVCGLADTPFQDKRDPDVGWFALAMVPLQDFITRDNIAEQKENDTSSTSHAQKENDTSSTSHAQKEDDTSSTSHAQKENDTSSTSHAQNEDDTSSTSHAQKEDDTSSTSHAQKENDTSSTSHAQKEVEAGLAKMSV